MWGTRRMRKSDVYPVVQAADSLLAELTKKPQSSDWERGCQKALDMLRESWTVDFGMPNVNCSSAWNTIDDQYTPISNSDRWSLPQRKRDRDSGTGTEPVTIAISRTSSIGPLAALHIGLPARFRAIPECWARERPDTRS